MNLIYPTEKEVIDFFESHSDYLNVYRISELLVAPHHNNLQEDEWRHVRKILHNLKLKGYLLVKNEGEDIYNEKFSSTPDRIEKYSEDIKKNKANIIKKVVERKFPISIEDYSDEELLTIVRSAENTNMSGSLYQKADKELQIRQNQKILDATTKGKGGVSIEVHGNVVSHRGDAFFGDKVNRDKKITNEKNKNTNFRESWWSNFWWILVVPLIGGIILFSITTGKMPQIFKASDEKLTTVKEEYLLATSTMSISDILTTYNSKETTQDKKIFIDPFENSNTNIWGSGTFADRDTPSEDKYLVIIEIKGGAVGCYFNSDDNTEKQLLIIKKGDKINFKGLFTGRFYNGGWWRVDDCVLE